MKRILYLFVAVLFATSAMAQPQSDIRTATLVHGDQTTVYYGVSAFADAYNAAADIGDVIILSPGVFNSQTTYTIKKSLTIYGCGYSNNEATGSATTTLPSISISFNKVTDEENNIVAEYPTVHIEGCYINGLFQVVENNIDGALVNSVIDNLCMRKCNCNDVQLNAPTKNTKFIQCYIGNFGYYDSWRGIHHGFTTKQDLLNVENCVINYGGGCTYIDSSMSYNHCIIGTVANEGYAHFTNSIAFANSFPTNCTAYNNILYATSLGSNVTGEGNYVGLTESDVFEGEGYYVMKTPDVHVGTDGTQIGIYGGAYPFDRNSSIPKITSSNIDIQTATDGKLNVSITVKAQTK